VRPEFAKEARTFKPKIVNDVSVPQFSRNTLRLIVCVLRGLLNAALEDGLITANPASRGEVH